MKNFKITNLKIESASEMKYLYSPVSVVKHISFVLEQESGYFYKPFFIGF